MRFEKTRLKDAYIVELDKYEDSRGFFARAFCSREFEQQGFCSHPVQANLSFSKRKGTLRGLHYQVSPATESKFIRCIRGAIWDVIVDMRPESPTYMQHLGVELSADNRTAIYVPDMFAHGHQTLVDDSEVFYFVSQFYTPGCERGCRYDDAAFSIEWPLPVSEISEKDARWPLLGISRSGGSQI